MEDLNVQTIAIPVEEYKELIQKQAELSLIYHKGAGGSVYDIGNFVLDLMTDLVKCDRCGTPFSIQTAGIRATWSGDYMVQYFTCPGCHHRYQILTTDTELRQTIQRHKAIAAKIKLGQTKHFRPGTLKKYQAEMEKLEAEQKKRRDELLDKGNEILAALGKE